MNMTARVTTAALALALTGGGAGDSRLGGGRVAAAPGRRLDVDGRSLVEPGCDGRGGRRFAHDHVGGVGCFGRVDGTSLE